jgi:uncharacterized repeat protein (TIGR03803 family)
MSFPKFTQALLLLLVGLAAVPSGWAQTYTVLYSFTGGTDGGFPEAGLIQDSGSNLYGTTGESVFKLNRKGEFTLLHNFGIGGAQVYAGVVRDSRGNLYGTTFLGGSSGAGSVFKVDKKGNYSVLHNFAHGTDGWGLLAPVILDKAGNLYGTAFNGGSPYCGHGSGCGVVFKLDTKGNETVLYSFAGPKYGEYPAAGLLRDAAGNLYGTTTGGGHGNAGTVFKLDPSGSETVLYTFKNKPDGKEPHSKLIQDTAGNFYGTTLFGGQGNCGGPPCGVVFKLDTNGNETVLYTFTGKSDGGNPNGDLIMDAAGNLYGTTIDRGNRRCGGAGCGVVFKLDPSGSETVLYTFNGDTDGGVPHAGLTMDSAGNLYGTTSYGGNLTDCQAGGCGVVFKITP